MWKQCVPKPRNHLKRGHYRPMNFAFDSPYKRRGGAIACRFQVSPWLFMGAVSDICFCCGVVMLRCPPLKLDASLCLRTHGLPPGRVMSELCLGSPRDPTSVPTFQLQAEMFVALHDQMIPPAAAQTPTDGGCGFRGCPGTPVKVHWQWGG